MGGRWVPQPIWTFSKRDKFVSGGIRTSDSPGRSVASILTALPGYFFNAHYSDESIRKLRKTRT